MKYVRFLSLNDKIGVFFTKLNSNEFQNSYLIKLVVINKTPWGLGFRV